MIMPIRHVIDKNGNQHWLNSKCWHHTNGPAYIHHDGRQLWYINGKIYYDNKSFQKAAKLSDEDMTAIVLKYGNVDTF
jgi:hypothetical protein